MSPTISALGTMVWVLLLALVHMCLATAVHEAGHLVMGLATGYRFVCFNLFGFVWVRQNGKLVVKRSKNNLIAGQCLMEPAEDFGRFKYGWYNAGGGLFNLIFAAVLCAGLVALWGAGPLAGGFFASGAAANLLLGLLNLVPMSLGVPNDGLNMLMAHRSPLAKKGLWLMLLVNKEVQQGRRYRDYPKEAFETDGPVNARNYLEVYMLALQAARLQDLGLQDEAMEVLGALDLGRVNGYYAGTLRLDYLYYYLVYNPDAERARALYQDRRVKQLLEIKQPTMMRIKAACLCFLEGKGEAAQRLLEACGRALEAYPSLGLRAMEADALEELEQAMAAAEQNSLDGSGGE